MRKQQKRDPILALIADHNAKLAAKEKAEEAEKRLEEKLDSKAGHQAKAEKRLLSHPYPPLWLGHAWDVWGRKGIRTHVLARLRDAGNAFGPKMRRKLMALAPAARKEIEQMLEAFHADHRRKRDAAGLTKLHSARMAALGAWDKALRRMCCSAPRTPEGAAALAEVLARPDSRSDFAMDYDLQLGLQSLARALSMAARSATVVARKGEKPRANAAAITPRLPTNPRVGNKGGPLATAGLFLN